MTGERILCCPVCKGALVCKKEYIVCRECRKEYPLLEGIPLLIADSKQHDEMLAEALREKSSWFEARQLQEKENPWRFILEKRRRYVQSVLSEELKRLALRKFPSLLDLGCGDGNNALWLKEYADFFYASDYNPMRILRTRTIIRGVTLYLADICQSPVSSDSVDCVYFNHVLEHIKDDAMALREVYRILKPGGLLILGVPNEGAFFWQLAYNAVPGSLESSDHCHFYTAESLQKKVRQAGFACLTVKHMGWGPPSWKWEQKINQHKILHEIVNLVGKIFLVKQSSALYLIARKKHNM